VTDAAREAERQVRKLVDIALDMLVDHRMRHDGQVLRRCLDLRTQIAMVAYSQGVLAAERGFHDEAGEWRQIEREGF